MNSYRTSFYDKLLESIEERSLSALESISNMVRDTRELEELASGIIAMACWGRVGLANIAEIALGQGSSRKSSSALKVFSLLAAGAEIDSLSFFIVNEQFLRRLREVLQPSDELKAAGREALFRFVHAAKTEDFLIPLGTTFTQIAFSDQGAAKELTGALSTKWLRYNQVSLEDYRLACKNHAGHEPYFQAFFEEFGQILDPLALQMWSEFDLQGVLRPDFVIRRFDDSYLIVEIECPSKRLMTQQCQLSAEVIHAEKQVLQYREFFSEHLREARAIMPNFHDPECLVVIGMEQNLNAQQIAALRAANRGDSK